MKQYLCIECNKVKNADDFFLAMNGKGICNDCEDAEDFPDKQKV